MTNDDMHIETDRGNVPIWNMIIQNHVLNFSQKNKRLPDMISLTPFQYLAWLSQEQYLFSSKVTTLSSFLFCGQEIPVEVVEDGKWN